jgi:hypothetical protein
MASAYFTVWRDLRAELRPIVLLAIGAVSFTTLLVGWVTKQWVPALPWGACFALGAIVSPPDAVAAKAILHGLPLPRRIVTILEGESLVNDASGLLLYRLAVAAVLTGSFHWGAAAASFVWLGCGGIAVGFAAGRLTVWVFEHRKSPYEVALMSFLAAWFTYIAADRAGISGVLAVVTCGLVMGWPSTHHGYGAGPYRSAGGLALHRCHIRIVGIRADRFVAARCFGPLRRVAAGTRSRRSRDARGDRHRGACAIAVGVSRRLPTAMAVAGAAPARSGTTGIGHPRHWMGRHARRGESGRRAVVAA